MQSLSHESGPVILKKYQAVKGKGMRAAEMRNGVQQDYLLRHEGGFPSKQVMLLGYFLQTQSRAPGTKKELW